MPHYILSTQPQQTLLTLKEEFYQTLSAPLDGMWHSFSEQASQWEIYSEQKLIGFFSINGYKQLLGIYIRDPYLTIAQEIFTEILQEHQITEAVVGTNNPLFLSLCMDHAKNAITDTLLYRDHRKVSISLPLPVSNANFRHTEPEDAERLAVFFRDNSILDKNWYEEYVKQLTSRGEVYILELDHEIIGISEIRKNKAQPDYADVGMLVNEKHRRQGLGAYLLASAKAVCYRYGVTPVCSCSIHNQSSRHAIEKVGFISKHRMLKVSF
ncbi:MAG: GNAT family N-acetyltransferase [Bacteroidia bacterium]|nr:GNAT family N-acetyltransferase [Bacteroidia bacterium]